MKNQVTQDTIVSEVLEMDKGTAPIFFSHGLHCLGCPSASGESLEDACNVHGIDCEKLVNELNDYLNK